MKAVLISIQPKWVEKIASGEKTIEVRKTKPKLETPFKCYIYCTMGKIPKFIYNEKLEKESIYKKSPDIINGKVIGEFVCDRIIEHESEFWDDETYESIGYIDYDEEYGEREKYIFAENGEENALCKHSCLTWNELREYIGQDIKTFYAWRISDLKIYDKPKSLEMFTVGKIARDCGCGGYMIYNKVLTRPPQSWCYVESLGGQ